MIRRKKPLTARVAFFSVVHATLNGNRDFCLVGDAFEDAYVTIEGRTYYEVRNVSGTSSPYTLRGAYRTPAICTNNKALCISRDT